MDKERAERYIGKKVFIRTNFYKNFTIDVTDVTDDHIIGTDLYGEYSEIGFNDISTIVPVFERNKRWT